MKILTVKNFQKTIALIILLAAIACGKDSNNLQGETPVSTRAAFPPSFQTPTRIATLTSLPGGMAFPTPSSRNITSPTPTSIHTKAPFVLLPPVPVQQDSLALDTNNIGRMIRLGRFGTGSPSFVAFSPDGKYLAVATGQGVFFFDASTFKQLRFMDLNSTADQLAFSTDGKKLLLASYLRGNTQVSLWNVETGQKIIEVNNDGYNRIVHKLAYSDSGYIAATSTERYWTTITRVWSVTDGRMVSESESEFYGASGEFLGFSLDGNTLYFPGNKNNALNLLMNEFHDVSPSQISSDLEVIPGSGVTDKDSGEISTTSIDGRYKALLPNWETSVEVIDIQTNQSVVTLPFDTTNSLAVGIITIGGAEAYVAATSDGYGRIVLWNLYTGKKIATSEQTDIAYGVAFSPDEQTLATESGGLIRLWNIDTLQELYEYETQGSGSEIHFSKDGSKIILTPTDGAYELNLWNSIIVSYPQTSFDYYQREIGTYDASSGYYYNISISSDLSEYFLNNLNTNSSVSFPVVSKNENDWFMDAIAISPDGKYLAGGLSASPIAVWDIQTKKRVAWMTGHQSHQTDVQSISIRQLDFSPWTDLLLSVGYDESTRLWDIQSGKQLAVLNVCCYAQFSPDGRILVTAGNGVIRVWGIAPWP